VGRFSRAFSLFVAVALTVAVVPAVALPAETRSRVIVRFADSGAKAAAMDRIRGLGGVKIKDLPMVGGAVIELPGRAAERAASAVRGVISIEPDIIIEALGTVDAQGKGGGKPTPPPAPAQVVPWGVDRIDAELVWPGGNTADPIRVAVVDTGIDLSHPDLAANVKGGANFVAGASSYADDNGHGTHVAGIIAAANNTIGVIGVAPAADLYAVKVLDRRGSGYLSGIIEGLTWCVNNHIQVVNMSLGTSSYSASFAQAVQVTLDAGVVVVAAAGNSGPGAYTVDYPGAFAGVIAVGATDSSDNIASWSSRGPQVAVCAPGVGIRSTYKGSTYQTLSGTSMASPHVAGVVALVLNTADPDGDGWSPAEVRDRIIARVWDLGPVGFDASYGYGLVRANLAVAP
jgi:subtilisin